jgi:hypothetical protein
VQGPHLKATPQRAIDSGMAKRHPPRWRPARGHKPA